MPARRMSWSPVRSPNLWRWRGAWARPDAETKDIKEAVLELVQDLPNGATWEDVMYRVYVREAIEAGRKDAAEGRLLDVAEVRRRFGLPE